LRRFRFPRHLLPALSLALISLSSGLANAGPEPTDAELTQARERFGAARKLEDAGRWSDALALLDRVAEVKMTPQVRFHIALCRENLGQWTEALDGYAHAADEAKSNAPDVVTEANEHIRKLEGIIPTVTVHVLGAAAGDELFLDRRAVPIDERPLAIRADPGPHSAEVRRGETVVARESFTLEPKTTRRIELKVEGAAQPPSGGTGLPGNGGTNGPGGAVAHGPGGSPPPPSRDGSTQRTLGYAALGLAGASVIATGVFIGLRANALSQLKDVCPKLSQCPSSAASIVSEGKTYAALVNVFGILSGVAAAGGVVLLVNVPPRPSTKGKTAPVTTFTLSPAIGFSVSGLSFEGAF
jgi:hypothetical protein